MEESLLQILLNFLLFFSHLIPSLWLFLHSPRSPSSQTLQVLAREKSFVKSVVSGQLHFEASSKFTSKSRLSWTLHTCDPVFSYLLFFLKRKLKRPERISKRSNNEEFYVKVKFIPLGYAWSSYLFQREFFFSHGITDKTIADNTKRARSTRKSFGLQATKKLPFNLELL